MQTLLLLDGVNAFSTIEDAEKYRSIQEKPEASITSGASAPYFSAFIFEVEVNDDGFSERGGEVPGETYQFLVYKRMPSDLITSDALLKATLDGSLIFDLGAVSSVGLS